jgi:hypothetical protein
MIITAIFPRPASWLKEAMKRAELGGFVFRPALKMFSQAKSGNLPPTWGEIYPDGLPALLKAGLTEAGPDLVTLLGSSKSFAGR